MAKKIYLSALVAGGIFFLTFYLLGGFKEVTVQPAGNQSFTVAGQHFYGRYDDEKLEQLFKNTRDMIIKDLVEGELCVIAYPADTLAENYVSQFIGINLKDTAAKPAAGMEIRKFAGEGAKVVLEMHPFVMPKPDEVQKLLLEHAATKGWNTRPYFIEIYRPDAPTTVHLLKE